MIGLALAAFLVLAEYLLIKKSARERAARFHRKVEIDSSEQSRIRSITTFALFLPFAFALGWWILWG
ncbi:MAG: hypothetical protein ACREUN_09570 [Burkholderiales bacterium]